MLRELEKDQKEAKIQNEQRKSEIYKKIPRIQEIDETLGALSFKVAKTVLSGQNDVVLSLKSEMAALREEKAKLLKKNRISEDFLLKKYKCEMCKDTGFVDESRCDCLKQRLIDKYYDISNLKQVVKTENFDMLDFRYYSEEISEKTGISPLKNIQNIFSVCTDFVNNFDTNKQNLFFYGETGLGKTFLCNAVAKEILEKGNTVLYLTAPQMFKKIEDARFNRTEDDFIDEQIAMIYETKLLVIDDLGSEFGTIVTNAALFDIVNTRAIESRSTIISTNFSMADLQNAYSDRVVSRFLGNYKMMRFFGDDIRLLKMHKAYS